VAVTSETQSETFTEFFREAEPRLRRALAAAAGIEAGREATAEALAYGWEHWDRVGSMENPAGYLYRVGRSKARKRVEVNPSEFVGGVQFCLPS
jgi:predicted RNA polymerase sigma factor